MRSIRLAALLVPLVAAAPAVAQVGVPRVNPGGVPNPTRPANASRVNGPMRNANVLPDLTIETIRHHVAEKSVDVFVLNRGGTDAPQCQVTLEVVNGAAVTKTVILILPPTPHGGRQVLNFPTAGWGAQLASATGVRVVVNSNQAFSEGSLANNTLFRVLNATPVNPGTQAWITEADAPDLVVAAVERVPGQNAVRVRIANQGGKPEGGVPTVTVYALPASYGWSAIYQGADTVRIDAANAESHLDRAWAMRETHVQGMAVGQSNEVVLTFPAEKPKAGCGYLGCGFPGGGGGSLGSSSWTSPETFGASVFYALVRTSIEVKTDNNGKLAGPFGP